MTPWQRAIFSTRHHAAVGYQFYKTLTVQAGQVTGTLTSFPMMVQGTYSYLAGTGHGGQVTNANGYDIIFSSTSNPDGSGIIPFERVSYNSTTGAVVFFVNVASMAVGSVIYMLYGNSAITTDQANPTAVWDANFIQISHLNQASGGTLLDSTSYGNNSSSNTGTQTTGEWDKAVAFAASQFAAFPPTLSGTGASSPIFTISSWVNFPNASNYDIVLDTRDSTTAGCVIYGLITTGAAIFSLSGTVVPAGGANIGNAAWHYVSMTYSGGLHGTEIGYVDANTPISATATLGVQAYGATFNIGTKTVGGGAGTYNAVTGQQELRVSNIVRPPAWVAAEYKNQSAPSSFYSIT